MYDAILFSNEMEILEVRLHELHEVVDKFVIVESDHTFTGSIRLHKSYTTGSFGLSSKWN